MDTNTMILFLQCEGCGRGMIAELDVTQGQGQFQSWMSGAGHSLGTISKTYPETIQAKAPTDTPAAVQSAYLSGLDNLGRKGGTNAAAIMFRRSIEIAAKAINPTAAEGR
jgi:hypothetical protein